MSSTIPTSFDNTNELKELIINNPDLPLLIFAGEEAYNDDFAYSMAEVTSVEIKELTICKDNYMEKEEYRDHLIDLLDHEYKDLPDDEFMEKINKRIEGTEFTKAIVVFVG